MRTTLPETFAGTLPDDFGVGPIEAAAGGGGGASAFAALAVDQGFSHYYEMDAEADQIGSWANATYFEDGTEYTSVDDSGNGWTRLASGYPTNAAGAVELTSFTGTSYLAISTTAGEFLRREDRTILFCYRTPATLINSAIFAQPTGTDGDDFWGSVYMLTTPQFRFYNGGATTLTGITPVADTWYIIAIYWDESELDWFCRFRPLGGSVVTTGPVSIPTGSATPATEVLRFCGGGTGGALQSSSAAISCVGTADGILSAAQVEAWGLLLDEGLVV